MKLLLTSYRIPSPKALIELVGNEPQKISIAIIPNAKDYYAQRARDFKINETKKYLKSLGLLCNVVDLKDYDDSKLLAKKLQSFDALWVSGGNTFCLRHEMRRSGFEKVIKDLMIHGLVYCGESAGAVVAGKTLRGIESADEPAFAESIIYEGLSLAPYIVAPHADNAFFADSVREARELHGQDPFYVELKDNECMSIDGEEMEIVKA